MASRNFSGPGGWGDRPGGRRRDERGPTGFEGAALEVARELDKPLLAGDLAAQVPPLEKLVLAAGKARVRSLDALPEGARGKLLTALLRVMRQTTSSDAAREQQRRKVFATLGQAFRALGDERRAGLAFAEAGEVKAAAHLLAHTGEWSAVAALHEREGRPAEAAKLHAEHGQHAEAARLFLAGGDAERALDEATLARDEAAIRAAASALPAPRAKAVLLGRGLGDLYLEGLARAGRWDDVARLYEQAGQLGDAARAHEKAGRTHKAMALFDRAGEGAEAERLIAAEARAKAAQGDAAGAAAVWARFGRPARAAELAPDPESAHRFLVEAGDLEGARRRALAEGRARTGVEAARWLHRAGETAAAAAAFLEGGMPLEAARLFEELHEWADAARAHEAAGAVDRARELYARAGDDAAAQRLANTPGESARANTPGEPEAPA